MQYKSKSIVGEDKLFYLLSWFYLFYKLQLIVILIIYYQIKIVLLINLIIIYL